MNKGTSNKAFLLELVNRPEVQCGDLDIGWLDRLAAQGEHLSRSYADVALVQAAIEAYEAELAVEQAQFYASAVRGRPQVRSEAGRTVEMRYRGHSYSLRVYRRGPRQYRVEADGSGVDVHIDRLGPFEYWLTGCERRFHVVSAVQGLNYRIEVDGVAHRVDRDDGGVVHAPAPAVVVSITVKEGDTVSVGDRLAVLEAMKMEMQVVAPFSGKVRHVMTIPNVQVDMGAPLLQIEPAAGDDAIAAKERVIFGASLAPNANEEDFHSRCRQNLEELRQLLLGFDVDPAHTAQLLAEWTQYRPAPPESDEIREREDEILNTFVDICSLFQRQPEVDNAIGGEAPTAEANLFAYLRMLETRGEGLPTDFVGALRRALAHYGVRTLERSPQLEESLLWIYKSHQRLEQQIAPVLSVLGRRLEPVEVLAPPTAESFQRLLDRMISVTRGLFPAVSDLAREVRYRYFDQPLFERTRKQIYAEMQDHLAHLAADPETLDRRERVRALVECPQPLASLISGRFAGADTAFRQLLLEVLTWRYYRIRTLTNFRSQTVDGFCCVSAEYDEKGKHVHVFTAHAEFPALSETAQGLVPLIEEVPADHDVVIDFCVWHSG